MIFLLLKQSFFCRSAHEIGIPIEREDSEETIEIPVQIKMDR